MVTYKHFFTNPIKKFVPDGGYTSIFRTIGFIGDSLSSGEHESFADEKKGFHDGSHMDETGRRTDRALYCSLPMPLRFDDPRKTPFPFQRG